VRTSLLSIGVVSLLSCGGPVDEVEESLAVESSELTYAGTRAWPQFVETAPVLVDEVLAEPAFANHPDGDTPGIQEAIERCVARASSAPTNHCTVTFSRRRYVMRRQVAGGHGIMVTGRRITLAGNGATIFNATTFDHNWGDTIDVVGLLNGRYYPRYAKTSGKHEGAPEPSEYVTLEHLVIDHEPSLVGSLPYRNCLGLVHANHVRLVDVECRNSHQSAFAAVSYRSPHGGVGGAAFTTELGDLVLDGARAVNSGQHAFRFHLQDDASVLEVRLKRCSASQAHLESLAGNRRELGARPVHLWYRAAAKNSRSGHATLRIEGSTFDATGQVVATQGIGSALALIDTDVRGGLHACVGTPSDWTAPVWFQNVGFACNVRSVVEASSGSVLDGCLAGRFVAPFKPVSLSGIRGGKDFGTRWLSPGGSVSSCFTAPRDARDLFTHVR